MHDKTRFKKVEKDKIYYLYIKTTRFRLEFFKCAKHTNIINPFRGYPMNYKFLLTASILSLAVTSNTTHAIEIPDYEEPRIILGTGKSNSLLEDLNKYMSAELSSKPWSGSYWGYLHGNLGYRYRDLNMSQMVADQYNFKSLKKYALDESPAKKYSSYEDINNLSPSEKYDLLIGDDKFTLTESVWADGQSMMNRRLGFGNIPLWRGICHGLAPASAILPRPQNAVTLTTKKTNQKLTFFPDDIKALGSLLYAKANMQVNFMGKRCSAIGTSRSDQCIGINPGSLHQLIINRIAIQNKAVVLDMSRGPEVWNYPIESYQVKYFNVLNEQVTSSLSEAIIPLYRIDEKSELAKNRAKGTKSIVGVKLTLFYPEMTPPSLAMINTQSDDVVKSQEFIYDLELDMKGKIIGGEYHSFERPDFAWFPTDTTTVLADGESSSLRWSNEVISDQISKIALKASKESQPMAVIVEKLFELAK